MRNHQPQWWSPHRQRGSTVHKALGDVGVDVKIVGCGNLVTPDAGWVASQDQSDLDSARTEFFVKLRDPSPRRHGPGRGGRVPGAGNPGWGVCRWACTGGGIPHNIMITVGTWQLSTCKQHTTRNEGSCDESERSKIAAAQAQPHDDQSESHHRTLNVMPLCSAAVTQDGWT